MSRLVGGLRRVFNSVKEGEIKQSSLYFIVYLAYTPRDFFFPDSERTLATFAAPSNLDQWKITTDMEAGGAFSLISSLEYQNTLTGSSTCTFKPEDEKGTIEVVLFGFAIFHNRVISALFVSPFFSFVIFSLSVLLRQPFARENRKNGPKRILQHSLGDSSDL